MAITQNTYTGDGTTVLFSFTFPYLETTDIKVSLNGTLTTAYTLANATTIQFTTAPANGVAIRIYRQTDDTALNATFYPGSAIRSQDLNDNFTQNLYVTQESSNNATAASTTASGAVTTANSALSTANSALATANSASTTASAASASAASAVSTATAASTSAASAVTTAQNAENKADQAINAVANAILYTLVPDVASIPASPSNNDAVEVFNSTGIESFTPISGVPAGYVGDGGLSVRIVYSTAAASWTWVQYFPNDPESRYGSNISLLQLDVGNIQSDVSQAQTDILGLDSSKLAVTTAASTYQTIAGMSNYVGTADIGVTVQAFDATILKSANIGSTVQAYDADTAKTDVAQNFTAAQRGSYVTLTDAATVAIDLSLGNHFQVTLGGNRTFGAPTNVVAGQSGVIRVVQDGTGSRTAAWNSVFKFPGGTAPTLTTAANSVDLVAYHVESATRIAARFIGDVK